MPSVTENLEKMLSQYLIIDPSIISRSSGFHILWFLRDRYRPNTIVLPTSLYHTLREGRSQEILQILKKWQWTLPIEEAEEWVRSAEFTQGVSNLLDISLPASEFWKLGKDPSLIEELATEIREVAVKLGAPLVANSRCFKRWLIRRGVTILEASNREYKKFKGNLRREYRESLKVRLAVRGIQWALRGTLLITIILALQPGTLPVVLTRVLPSVATMGVDRLYQAIVIDP